MQKNSSRIPKARIQDELRSLDDLHTALNRRVNWLLERKVADPYLMEDVFAALAMTLHDMYTGCERILLHIISNINGGIPKSDEWHREVLRQASLPLPGIRGPILSDKETWDFLSELRGLRHVIRNVYVHRLKRENLLSLGKSAVDFYPRFKQEIEKFVASHEATLPQEQM